jgi:hypothetical protein
VSFFKTDVAMFSFMWTLFLLAAGQPEDFFFYRTCSFLLLKNRRSLSLLINGLFLLCSQPTGDATDCLYGFSFCFMVD